MRIFLLFLMLAVFFLPQTNYAQKHRKEKKHWEFKHAESGETTTFTEGQRMKVKWLLNGKKHTIKAKLFNIDKDTVSFLNGKKQLNLAKKDIKKITVYNRSGAFWGTALGVITMIIAMILLIGMIIVSFLAVFIYLFTLGTSQVSNDFNFLPVIGLLIVGGLLTAFVANSRKTVYEEPFGESWIMQTPPTKLEQIP